MIQKKDWKLSLKNWMINQKSTKNNDNNMDHKIRIGYLKSILSDSFELMLSETSFKSPDVMENVIASYIDVSEYIKFIAFRFPDLSSEILMDRLYGLGVHLENEGLTDFGMNPNFSAMAKFGAALQEVVKREAPITALSDDDKRRLKVSVKQIAKEHSLSDDTLDLFLDRIENLSYSWVAQVLDVLEIENDRKKFRATDIGNWDLRHRQVSSCNEVDTVIAELRKELDSLSDVRTFLDSSYEPVYSVRSNKSRLSYPEDVKLEIESRKNVLMDKEKITALADQLILEDSISLRSRRPGDRAAPELVPLRELLMGRRIFREGTDIESLIEKAEQEGQAELKGKSEFFHQEFERSLAETKAALSHLRRKPILGKAVTMSVPLL